MHEKHKPDIVEINLFPKRKPKVFISSRCDGDYISIRKQIVEWFKSIPLFEFYDFNSEGASTLPLPEAYLSKVDTCDIFLLILDNEKGVTPGIKKEIDRASELNKPCLGIFINGDESPVRAQDFSPYLSLSKYAAIQTFDDAAKTVIASLLQDLVDRYQLQLGNYGFENSQTFNVADIGVKKSIHELAQPLAKYLIHRDYPYLNMETGETDFSAALLSVFQCVIGLSGFSKKAFSTASDYFVVDADKTFKVILEKRFTSLNFVFRGFLRDGKSQLESILKQDIQALPEWLKDDIYLDLRNISIRLDQNEGLRRYGVDGQKELNESAVVIHYPYLDRCFERLWEELDDRFYERKTRSANTIVFGDNLNFYYFLAEAFVTAFSFGSYTHLVAFRNKYFRFQYRLCYEGDEKRRFGELNRLAVLTLSEKNLQKIWNIVPRDDEIIRKSNVAEVAMTIKSMPVRVEKKRAALLSITYLGNYLSDDDFDFFFGICDRDFITRFCENDFSNIDISMIVRMYSKNVERIGTRIKGFLDSTKDYNFTSFDLSSICALCEAGFEERCLFPLFFEYVKNRVKIDGYSAHESFFVNARLNYSDFSQSIDEFVYSHASASEVDEYRRFCAISDPTEAIKHYTKRINSLAVLFQTHAAISYPMERPCDEAANFINVHRAKIISSAEIDALAKSAIDLLNLQIEQSSVKYSATKLLCVLDGAGLGQGAIVPFKSDILNNVNRICSGLINSPMETVTSANVWFALCVLGGMRNERNDYIIREALMVSFESSKDKIASLSILNSALLSSSEPPFSAGTLIAIMDFSWRCFLDDNVSVSNSGLNILKLLGNYPEYKDTIARGFRDLYNLAAPEQKVAITAFFMNNDLGDYLNSIKRFAITSVCWNVKKALGV